MPRGSAFTDRLDPSGVLDTVLAQACRLLKTSHGCIYLCTPDGSALERRLGTGLFALVRDDGSPGQEVAEQVWRSGQPVLVADYQAWPGRARAAGGIQAMVGVPLESGDRVVGVVGVAHGLGSGQSFADAELELLSGFAQMAALALDNARLYAEERRSHEEAERLRAATVALSASLDLHEVLVLILSELRRVVPYDSASLQELKGEKLEIIGGHGFPNLPEILGLSFDIGSPDHPNREVVRRRAPVIVADAPASYPRFDSVPHAKAGIRSFLGVPLLFGDQLIGMLALDSKEVGFFTEHHARLALAFAAQASIAIQNARLHTAAQAEIAERKRAEARLEESENLLRTIIESEPECVKLVAADGTLLQMNPAGLAMIEADSRDQVLGMPISKIVLPEWRSAFNALAEAVFRGEAGDLEFEIAGLKGTRRWLETRAVPLRNPNREIVALLGVTRDITARKQAEAALLQSQARLSEAQRIAHLGNWEWDITINDLWWSDEVYRIFGSARGEFGATYESFLGFVHPDDRDFVRRSVDQALHQGRPYSIDHRILLRDGTQRFVHEEAVVRFDESGTPIRMAGTVQDITDRKRTEQALREREEQLRQAHKIEAVGRLAGGVAHDFNNLLNVIMGYGELLLRDLSPGTQARARLDQILRAADRAAALTRQLLAFSRRQVLQPRLLDLDVVVLDTESMLRRLIGEDIEVVTVAGAGLGQVKADPGQVEQVLMNLAVNARDAMPRGGRMTIATARADLAQDDPRRPAWLPAGPYVMLTVSDTGMGMDAETLAHLFEPFFTTKEQGKGTGLGLATVYGIVKQSGGYVQVESEVGRGSTFRVYLPRVDERSAEPEAAPPGEPSPRGSETVLAVEDETALLDFVRELLRESGYAVIEARTVEEAVRACENHPGAIDLLLTDVVMPGMSGPQLAARLAPVRPQMKVLYMSGYTDDALGLRGVLDSGVALLQKPFTAEALTRKIREVLAARS
jgi:PAS domain S-box-containing protein